MLHLSSVATAGGVGSSACARSRICEELCLPSFKKQSLLNAATSQAHTAHASCHAYLLQAVRCRGGKMRWFCFV
eukprot:6197322-Pleurochrysis_carterae.AAC.1